MKEQNKKLQKSLKKLLTNANLRGKVNKLSAESGGANCTLKIR